MIGKVSIGQINMLCFNVKKSYILIRCQCLFNDGEIRDVEIDTPLQHLWGFEILKL